MLPADRAFFVAKAFSLGLATALLMGPAAYAIPDSFFGNGFSFPIIPAHPRFGADLTEEFLNSGRWEGEDFSVPWEAEPALEGERVRRITAKASGA